jgi:hypothetical protein
MDIIYTSKRLITLATRLKPVHYLIAIVSEKAIDISPDANDIKNYSQKLYL